jgi:hypothetical protein
VFSGGGRAGAGVTSIGSSLWDGRTKRTVMPFISLEPEVVAFAVAVPSAKPTTLVHAVFDRLPVVGADLLLELLQD